MARVQIAGYKGPGNLVVKGIRGWTGGEYSHIELIVDGMWYSSSIQDGGVRAKAIEPVADHWSIMDLPWADADKILAYYEKTKDAKYGMYDLITKQFFRLPLPDSDAQFCSEWCASALGIPRGRNLDPTDLMGICAWRNNS